MGDNYAKLVLDNLNKIYETRSIDDLVKCLPGTQEQDYIVFNAFGEKCQICSKEIIIGNKKQQGVTGILISLYALNAGTEACVEKPFKAFKDFPNSAPYAGAFTTHTQNTLIPYVSKIKQKIEIIKKHFKAGDADEDISGDFSFIVQPLPKISLCYIFYEADEDFPASVTCLYSNNASMFIPIDGLADIGEYTSKKIIEIIKA